MRFKGEIERKGEDEVLRPNLIDEELENDEITPEEHAFEMGYFEEEG